MRGLDYIEHLLGVGRCTFTAQEVVKELDKSRDSANMFVYRLREKGKIVSPAKGFHVIVPPQYRRLKCLPAKEFLPYLMEYWDMAYYVGLLTAAFFHGAAHQQPQVFQVMLPSTRPDIECGQVHIKFHQRSGLTGIPTQKMNAEFGQFKLSTPEATAIDLIGYANQIGGIDRVATIFAELGNKIDGDVLKEVGPTVAPNAWLQRVGYLLEYTGHAEIVESLAEYIEANVKEVAPLNPQSDYSGSPRVDRWFIAVNQDIESDI